MAHLGAGVYKLMHILIKVYYFPQHNWRLWWFKFRVIQSNQVSYWIKLDLIKWDSLASGGGMHSTKCHSGFLLQQHRSTAKIWKGTWFGLGLGTWLRFSSFFSPRFSLLYQTSRTEFLWKRTEQPLGWTVKTASSINWQNSKVTFCINYLKWTASCVT